MKINISLTPYDALAIYSFLAECSQDLQEGQAIALTDAIENYSAQVRNNLSNKQIDDAMAESQVNKLIGKEPEH